MVADPVRRRRIRVASLVLGGVCLGLTSAFAQSQSPDLSTATLEALTQIQISVSSFARKDQDLWHTPAAVFVITREDIARSSATSIPELLRIVPGLQVAQVDASTWAVTARGFNSEYANKLLVLVDGRTVYSELYAGEHWDQIDLPLEDLERIEVIRGSGAAVWGTNAVNGVVNIITRRSRSTMGLHSSGTVSRIGSGVDLRYGGAVGSTVQYRAFANYLERNPFELSSGKHAFDGENTLRGGGRLDWQQSLSNSIIASGDLYGGHLKQQILPVTALPVGPNGHDTGSTAGGYILSRWEHKVEKSDMASQIYYDDQSRHELGAYGRIRTFDIDFQDHLAAGARNDVVWGAEFRRTAIHLLETAIPLTTRNDFHNYLVDAFLQDDIAVIPQRLIFTLGSKIQTGTLAGFQAQPSARILWAPSSTQSMWAAVSRSAVAPSIEEKYVRLPLNIGVEQGLPISGLLQGNANVKPETVIAYEGGYRRRLGNPLTLDVAAFFNDTRRIAATIAGASVYEPAPSPHIQTALSYTNGFAAKAAGIETSLSWRPLTSVIVQASYTWMQVHEKQTEPGILTQFDTWNSPRNAMALSASWHFANRWNATSFVSYTGSLDPSSYTGGLGASASATNLVPAYTRVDLHLTRQLGRSFQFDGGGTNLQTPRHLEFGSGTGFVNPAYVPRSFFIKGTWTF